MSRAWRRPTPRQRQRHCAASWPRRRPTHWSSNAWSARCRSVERTHQPVHGRGLRDVIVQQAALHSQDTNRRQHSDDRLSSLRCNGGEAGHRQWQIECCVSARAGSHQVTVCHAPDVSVGEQMQAEILQSRLAVAAAERESLASQRDAAHGSHAAVVAAAEASLAAANEEAATALSAAEARLVAVRKEAEERLAAATEDAGRRLAAVETEAAGAQSAMREQLAALEVDKDRLAKDLVERSSAADAAEGRAAAVESELAAARDADKLHTAEMERLSAQVQSMCTASADDGATIVALRTDLASVEAGLIAALAAAAAAEAAQKQAAEVADQQQQSAAAHAESLEAQLADAQQSSAVAAATAAAQIADLQAALRDTELSLEHSRRDAEQQSAEAAAEVNRIKEVVCADKACFEAEIAAAAENAAAAAESEAALRAAVHHAEGCARAAERRAEEVPARPESMLERPSSANCHLCICPWGLNRRPHQASLGQSPVQKSQGANHTGKWLAWS